MAADRASQPLKRRMRRLDIAVAGGGLVVLVVWLWRVTVAGTLAFDSRGQLAVVASIVAGILIVFTSLAGRASRPRAVAALRPLVYAIALGLATSLASRLSAGFVPIAPAGAPADISFADMADADRAHWAVRVASLAAFAGRGGGVPLVPVDWPFPPDAELAVRDSAGERNLVGRAGKVECAVPLDLLPERWATFHDGPHCAHVRETALAFAKPIRAPIGASVSPPAVSTEGWRQYRRDAEATASLEPSGAGAAWTAELLGGARSSASAVGRHVLIGTHGAGTLESFDVATGRVNWRAVLPNWVHQDAVSDGRYVAVGFGDGDRSFRARAPGGIAVFAAADGQLQWATFLPGSQMTSPVLLDSTVTYVNWTGLLEMRVLRTGRLLWSVNLPGYIAMGPPVLAGDTLVVTLDDATVCVVALSARRVRWCTSYPGLAQFGVSSPTLVGDTILISARVPPTIGNFFRNLGRQPIGQSARWMVGFLRPNGHLSFEAQRVLALRLADGAIVWRSADHFVRRRVQGHISGKPVFDSSVIAVTLPLPNVVAAYERRTLANAWTAEGVEARGPVLFLDGRVYYATGDGELRVHEAQGGALRCAVRVGRGFDRTGPALARGSFFFGTLEGELVSVPRRYLDACHADSVQSIFGPRRAPSAPRPMRTLEP